MQYRVKQDIENKCWDIECRRFWPLPWELLACRIDKAEAIELAKRLAAPEIINIRQQTDIWYG